MRARDRQGDRTCDATRAVSCGTALLAEERHYVSNLESSTLTSVLIASLQTQVQQPAFQAPCSGYNQAVAIPVPSPQHNPKRHSTKISVCDGKHVQKKGSATVLILGNSGIAKIVNLRLPFLKCAAQSSLGPAPNPGMFSGTARKIILFVFLFGF